MKGLYIGKFQPFHLGHLRTFEFLSLIVDEIIVGLGSPQETNYFSLSERINMIRDNTNLNPIILEDLEESHPLYWDWGRYVLENTGEVNIIASGNSHIRDDFLKHEIPVIWMPRFYGISGTAIREKISHKDDSWSTLVTKVSEKIIKKSDFYRKNYNG